MKPEQSTYFVEVTDTFGGEANYCWARRYKVIAKSTMGAIRKVGHDMGLNFRKAYDSGDEARYNAQHACICAFVEWFDETRDYPFIPTSQEL